MGLANKKVGKHMEVEQKVFTSLEEVNQAILKLGRRLAQVCALDLAKIDDDDPAVSSAAQNFSNTVLEIYGPDTPEYRRYQHHSIWHGPMYMGMHPSDIRAGVANGVVHTIAAIENLIRTLEEKKADFGADTTSRVREAFEGLDLHPRIAGACADLYRDGHYADAVLRASLALEYFVKEKSGRDDIGGSTLMEHVFSVNSPVLAFNSLADQSDKDKQRGMSLLFQGMVFALRHPRAHKLLEDSPEEALESIALISLLAKRLERAKRASINNINNSHSPRPDDIVPFTMKRLRGDTPLAMVTRESPQARLIREMPPWPSCTASFAAIIRRLRSSK